MRRIVKPEILDGHDAPTPEVEQSLIDLRRINRWFGGTNTTYNLIDIIVRETGKTALTLLDVGSATGDIPSQIKDRFHARKIQIRHTLLDREATHLPKCGDRIRGDALALPFRDNSFDLISCALFAHHLEPDHIASFAQEALRVCRVALLINDLRRSYLHLLAVHAGAPLFGRITRHDSVASVWRSYTPAEMRHMLNHGTAHQIDVRNSYLFRMGVIAWK